MRNDSAGIDAIVSTTDPAGLALGSARLLITVLRGLVGDDPQHVDNVLALLQDGWRRLQLGEDLE